MKTTQKTKDRTKRTPQNMRGLYDWVSSSCFTSGTRRVTLLCKSADKSNVDKTDFLSLRHAKLGTVCNISI
jgi:hypothetical protein